MVWWVWLGRVWSLIVGWSLEFVVLLIVVFLFCRFLDEV